MNESHHLLLHKLQALHAKISRGDREALAFVQALKDEAQAGSRKAKLTYNTLAAIHWGRTGAERMGHDPSVTWQKAEAFYEKLLADDVKAWERMREIRAGVSRNDTRSRQAFSMLKAVHRHKKESVWYPGAPQIGYHPMPSEHRPGIVFGAAGSLDIVGFEIPGLGSFPTPGGVIPNQVPGNLGQLGNFLPGGLPDIPGVTPPPSGIPGLVPAGNLGDLGNILNQIVPGMLPGDQGVLTVPGQTKPLSTDASQRVLGQIAFARQALPPEQRVLGGGSAANPNLSPFAAQKMEEAARRLEIAPLNILASVSSTPTITAQKAAEAKRSAQLQSAVSMLTRMT